MRLLLEPRLADGDRPVLPDAVHAHGARPALDQRVAAAEPGAAMVQRAGDDAAAADEPAGRFKVLVDAGHIVAITEMLAVAVEDRLPDRRRRRLAGTLRAAAAGLQLQVVDRSEQQPRIGS